MAHLSSEEIAKYAHSPVHLAVARRDYQHLRRIISALPKLAKAGEIRTETDAITEEHRAEALSAVIDRRDVPGRETPLHLAVRMGDVIAAEILMSSGADWSLQNEQGWSALQEAICAREEGIAMVIMRHYQPMAWAKWCRRLPRVIGTMQRMRDFYMEVTFHFESSVIPFIGRIAPSDTYRIWKRGSNLRADMTLAGFDGFRIQRSDQTFLFLGEGSNDGKLSPGSLCMLNHRDKEIMNALEGAGMQPSEAETAQEVAAMSQTNMYRPGIDVTQAALVPQMTWRRQEKTEMVGEWKAKVMEMHNVQVSVKSRRVPGAMTDEELFGGEDMADEEEEGAEDYAELLTEEEKKQLESALRMEEGGVVVEMEEVEEEEVLEMEVVGAPRLSSYGDGGNSKKGWLGGWGSRRSMKQEDSWEKQQQQRRGGMAMGVAPGRSSVCVDREKVSNLLEGGEEQRRQLQQRGRRSVDHRYQYQHHHHHQNQLHPSLQKKKKSSADSSSAAAAAAITARRRRVTPAAMEESNSNSSSEYKKGLRPVLWLTPSFPLQTHELLPLLDILANKVKAVRRLRELLTTKLPPGTFPVKVAIPVVPTIRVIVTFTKFEELPCLDQFATPPSSPDSKPHRDGQHHNTNSTTTTSSSSWFSWIKGSASKVAAGVSGGVAMEQQHSHHDAPDPFLIPTDYVWTSMDAKKRKSKEKKSKKKGKKVPSAAADHSDLGSDV